MKRNMNRVRNCFCSKYTFNSDLIFHRSFCPYSWSLQLWVKANRQVLFLLKQFLELGKNTPNTHNILEKLVSFSSQRAHPHNLFPWNIGVLFQQIAIFRLFNEQNWFDDNFSRINGWTRFSCWLRKGIDGKKKFSAMWKRFLHKCKEEINQMPDGNCNSIGLCDLYA